MPNILCWIKTQPAPSTFCTHGILTDRQQKERTSLLYLQSTFPVVCRKLEAYLNMYSCLPAKPASPWFFAFTVYSRQTPFPLEASPIGPCVLCPVSCACRLPPPTPTAYGEVFRGHFSSSWGQTLEDWINHFLSFSRPANWATLPMPIHTGSNNLRMYQGTQEPLSSQFKTVYIRFLKLNLPLQHETVFVS